MMRVRDVPRHARSAWRIWQHLRSPVPEWWYVAGEGRVSSAVSYHRIVMHGLGRGGAMCETCAKVLT